MLGQTRLKKYKKTGSIGSCSLVQKKLGWYFKGKRKISLRGKMGDWLEGKELKNGQKMFIV